MHASACMFMFLGLRAFFFTANVEVFKMSLYKIDIIKAQATGAQSHEPPTRRVLSHDDYNL